VRRVVLASHLKLIFESGKEVHHIFAVVKRIVERVIVNVGLALVQVEVAEESAQSMVRLSFLVEVEVKGVIGGGYKVIVVVVGL